ncbi:MAG: hypothetical protein DRJ10_00865 [Bacteroidetes bacterium]|nr:MAG: hypothetical protein DRJ10_00865 [Bacteroidota bacterium]RLD86146.1 MAG: hypothetical protein DRJ07_01520 [Bacteroidota bacterium]
MKNFKLLALILAGFMIFIYACETNDGTAKFNLHLTDAPGDYKEVWIDIQSIEVHFETDGEGEWMTLDELDLSDAPYDLLKLTNGVYELLASTDLPAGTISQIRLILGDDNSVVVEIGETKDGEEPETEEFDLKTPSAQTSGLKLNVHAQLEAGVTYNMWIDFDADKSIVNAGSGKYNLKPVIRTYTEATSGAIKGTVVTPILDSNPIEYEPIEGVTVSISFLEDGETENTVITTNTNEDGFFMLSGIPEGSYTVKFKQGDDVILEKTEVAVLLGNVTDLETILIE